MNMKAGCLEKIQYGHGHPKQKSDVTILVPHDGTFRDFQQAQPELARKLLGAIESDESTFRKLLAVEQDVFASDAAELIAEDISRELPWARIEVLKVLIPRAILDMNRIIRKAIWKVFDHDRHPDIRQALDMLHFEISTELRERIKGAKMVVDLHSMSPTDPWEKIEVNPGNLDKFVESWRKNPGKRRKNDIINQKKDHTGKIVPLGDPELIESVKTELEKFVLPVSMSGTFQLSGDHLGPVWAGMAKSYINIDFLKDNGSQQQLDDDDFDLSTLELETQRLARFTTPCARGILKVLKARSKK
jgi:hypothetical protein